MEKKKTATKTAAKSSSPKKPAETSKEKISRLTNSIDALSSEVEILKLSSANDKNTSQAISIDTISSELETLKLNIQKRKSENTTLKVLFYTGLIVLLIGFMYTNSTLQRAQMDNLESSIHSLRTLMNRELLLFEKDVFLKIDLLEKNVGERSKVNLQENLANMTEAISRLEPDDEKTAALIDRVKKYSKELSAAYSKQGEPASP